MSIFRFFITKCHLNISFKENNSFDNGSVNFYCLIIISNKLNKLRESE